MTILQPHFLPYALGRIREYGALQLIVNGVAISYSVDAQTRTVNLTGNVRSCSEAGITSFDGMWIHFPHDAKTGIGFCTDASSLSSTALDTYAFDGYCVSSETISARFLELLEPMWSRVEGKDSDTTLDAALQQTVRNRYEHIARVTHRRDSTWNLPNARRSPIRVGTSSSSVGFPQQIVHVRFAGARFWIETPLSFIHRSTTALIPFSKQPIEL